MPNAQASPPNSPAPLIERPSGPANSISNPVRGALRSDLGPGYLALGSGKVAGKVLVVDLQARFAKLLIKLDSVTNWRSSQASNLCPWAPLSYSSFLYRPLVTALCQLLLLPTMVLTNMALRHSKSWVKSDRGVTKDNRNLSVVNKAASGEIRMTSLRCCLSLLRLSPAINCPLNLQLQLNDVE